MAVYFFDSSALVKRHIDELGSAWVRSLTRVKAAHTLYIARITAVEITSAITRRQRGRSLSPAQAGAILGHFRRHLTQRYNVLELTPRMLADAMLMARKHGLRAYDAVQLTAMVEVNRLYQTAGLGHAILLSSDQELNTAASAEGLLVEDPSEVAPQTNWRVASGV
jgi:predicted nucleic acid-binding protein